MKIIILFLTIFSLLTATNKMQFYGHFKDDLFIFAFNKFNKKLCKFNKITLCQNSNLAHDEGPKRVEKILKKGRYFFVKFIKSDKGFFHCEIWDNDKFYNFELVRLKLATPLIKNKKFNQALIESKKTKGGICE